MIGKVLLSLELINPIINVTPKVDSTATLLMWS